MTPTSELDAINTILSVIGESPVNSIEDAQSADVAMAVNVLREVSREVQAEGWHFNIEESFTLAPNTDDAIVVPDSISYVDVQYPEQARRDVVLRGRKLYDRKNQTFEFDKAVSATVRRVLSFEDIPETMRHYVMVRAGRKLQDRIIGADRAHAWTQQDEMVARARLDQYEADQADNSPNFTPDIQYGMQR